jgi:hypothetical protein
VPNISPGSFPAPTRRGGEDKRGGKPGAEQPRTQSFFVSRFSCVSLFRSRHRNLRRSQTACDFGPDPAPAIVSFGRNGTVEGADPGVCSAEDTTPKLGSDISYGSKAVLGAFLSDVRFTPTNRHRRARASGPKSAMCGRLRVGKGFLHVRRIGRCSHVFGL